MHSNVISILGIRMFHSVTYLNLGWDLVVAAFVSVLNSEYFQLFLPKGIQTSDGSDDRGTLL